MGTDFTLDEPEGLTTFTTMKDIFRGCEMQNLE